VNHELMRSRRRFERALDEVRDALEAEVGWAPKLKRWALPVAVLAAGIVAGLAARRGLPRLRRLRR